MQDSDLKTGHDWGTCKTPMAQWQRANARAVKPWIWANVRSGPIPTVPEALPLREAIGPCTN